MPDIQTRDSDGSLVAVQGQRTDGKPPVPLPKLAGCTIRPDEVIPARPAGDKTSVLRWQTNALVWVAPTLTSIEQACAGVTWALPKPVSIAEKHPTRQRATVKKGIAKRGKSKKG